MDWSAQIDHELNRMQDVYRRLGPLAESDYARFRRDYPDVAVAIAEAIDLDVPRVPVALFDVGPVLYPSTGALPPFSSLRSNPRVYFGDSVDWWQLVNEHAAGRFGLYGRYDEDSPADRPVLVANKAAIATKSGAIRSRFVLPDRLHHAETPEAGETPKRVVVDVLTDLSARGPRTLMTIEFIDAV